MTIDFLPKIQVGTELVEIKIKRGGFWERLFDPDPTLHIWDEYKTEMVEVPVMKDYALLIKDAIIMSGVSFNQFTEALSKVVTGFRDFDYTYFDGYKHE